MATKKKITMILFVAIMTVLCCCVLSACNSKIKGYFQHTGRKCSAVSVEK